MITFKDNKVFLDHTILILEYPVYKMELYKNLIFILYHPNADNKKDSVFKNLSAYAKDGKKLWVAENPSQAQIFPYSDFEIQKNYFIRKSYLWAYSMGSYDCKIDMETGKILQEMWAK